MDLIAHGSSSPSSQYPYPSTVHDNENENDIDRRQCNVRFPGMLSLSKERKPGIRLKRHKSSQDVLHRHPLFGSAVLATRPSTTGALTLLPWVAFPRHNCPTTPLDCPSAKLFMCTVICTYVASLGDRPWRERMDFRGAPSVEYPMEPSFDPETDMLRESSDHCRGLVLCRSHTPQSEGRAHSRHSLRRAVSSAQQGPRARRDRQDPPLWVHGPCKAQRGWEERAVANMPYSYLPGSNAAERGCLRQSKAEKRWVPAQSATRTRTRGDEYSTKGRLQVAARVRGTGKGTQRVHRRVHGRVHRRMHRRRVQRRRVHRKMYRASRVWNI